jgi:ABC-type branched-subunit amino acid transport system substrate-binding protein
VVVVDDRSAYSKTLAKGVESKLRARGIKVTRTSVSQKVTDFSSLVTSIGPGDRRRLPALADRRERTDLRSAAEEAREGRRSSSARTVSIPVTSVSKALTSQRSRPDIRGIAGDAAFIDGYGSKFVSNFGPPMYVATQAAIAAIRKACADGDATRAEVQRNLRAIFIPKIVLGGNLRFTAHGDRKGATFFIFKVGAGGRKTLVG